ncbi:hypothetical protein J4421_01425 [Candidatus Woesearchaeota archaeon]|nr:hypothetical protein [Candidatus Woesearchaeota archaeon]
MSKAKLRFFNSLNTVIEEMLITEEIAKRARYKPLTFGHIGIEIDGRTYGFTPIVQSSDQIALQRVYDGLTNDDTDFFNLAGEVLEVGEKEIELAEQSRKIVLADCQNRTILPYAVLPHLLGQHSYNCLSYLRERAGINVIPPINHLAKVIKALSH